MITPSITFDDSRVKSLWAGLSIEDVKEMLRCDVEEIDRLHRLQSEAAKIASPGHRRVEEVRLRQLILGWEHAQDAHWSWFKEIADVSTGTAERPQTMGPGLVGSGH